VSAARGRYNLGSDLLDRHVLRGRGDRLALRFVDSGGFSTEYDYRRLLVAANRFAYVLRGLGVGRGDRVFFRVPNHPVFYYGALGCARIGAPFVPSSTLFKEAEIGYRLRDSGAVVAITTAELLPELERAAGDAPDLREILIVDDEGEAEAKGPRSLAKRMAAARDHVPAVDSAGDEPAFLAYTSGTTGEPKGILHLQRYARSYDYLIRDWHGYRDGDLAACPAEIGWMLPVASTFLYALRAGIGVLLVRERKGRFLPEAWFERLAGQRVASFVATPTILRMMLTVEDAERRFDLTALRRVTSAGEPLPAATLEEFARRFSLAPLDGIGMSECMVYAHARGGEEVVGGSCGRAGEGIELAILDGQGRETACGEPGVLAVKRASHPGMMREYWRKPERTAEVFDGDWYLSGDVVRRDETGRLYFVGRADDVMKCSGYRISPFEVEDALQAHPAVLEAGCVEHPDAIKGNVIHAFVTLAATADEGARRGDPAAVAALGASLRNHVAARLAPFKAPKFVTIVGELPKTQSGKIKRGELRARLAAS
jgi:acetyl-CoA synthetase